MNPKRIQYDTAQLVPILQNTYGILVYQEQVMQAVRDLAGFSKGQADLIRKAMGKKIQAILDEYRPYFIYGSGDTIDAKTKQPLNIRGCVNNGITEKEATIIWEKMENFAKYAFNKSHAAGYGVIAIKTAWLSYYYPEVFFMANLNAYMGDPKKVRKYIATAQKQGIAMLPPCVNESQEQFTVASTGIRFGLKGIRGVKGVSVAIMQERTERGPFTSFQNFVTRMVCNQKATIAAFEALIYAGALDIFAGTRRAKLAHLPDLYELAKEERAHRTVGQVSIFDFAQSVGLDDFKSIRTLAFEDLPELEKDILLEKEEELTGFYITEHPLDAFRAILAHEGVTDMGALDVEQMDEVELLRYEKPQFMRVAGIMSEVEIRYTKAGKPFARFVLKDASGEVSVQCFGRDYEQNAEQFIEGRKAILHGRFEINDFGAQFLCKQVRPLTLSDDFIAEVVVRGDKVVEVAREQWKSLKALCLKHTGTTPIRFYQNGTEHVFPESIGVNWESLGELQYLFGEQNCKLSGETAQ